MVIWSLSLILIINKSFPTWSVLLHGKFKRFVIQYTNFPKITNVKALYKYKRQVKVKLASTFGRGPVLRSSLNIQIMKYEESSLRMNNLISFLEFTLFIFVLSFLLTWPRHFPRLTKTILVLLQSRSLPLFSVFFLARRELRNRNFQKSLILLERRKRLRKSLSLC